MKRIVMPEDGIEKTLTVTGVTIVTELATGDFAYQVMFGYYLKTTPEIVGRILPASTREMYLASKNIIINEVSLIMKTDKAPYKIGSKWKMKIRKNGALSLVEVR